MLKNLNILKRSILDIRFSRAAFGYKASEVDNFIDDLQQQISLAVKECNELILENERLKSELKEMKRAQDSITRAIANSEKIAQASVIDASVRSKYILSDASKKASAMVDAANSEYEKKINEAKKINDAVTMFSKSCIQKFEDQIEQMKKFSDIKVSLLDLKNFQIDDVAKQFISEENTDTQIFSNSSSSDAKEENISKTSKYDNLQFGSQFATFQ